jgi:hypothetical protein
MAIHHLKTWPHYFQAIKRGEKTFELRFNDRGFREGDTLMLQEWDNRRGVFTGEWLAFKAGWVLAGGNGEWHGEVLADGYCIISLAPHPAIKPGEEPARAYGALGPTLRLVEAARP